MVPFTAIGKMRKNSFGYAAVDSEFCFSYINLVMTQISMWWCRKDLRYTELELGNARNKDANLEVTSV